MTEKEVELCVMGALAACSPVEECARCPLDSEANDGSCPLYIMAICRDPEAFEIRGGRVEPKEAE